MKQPKPNPAPDGAAHGAVAPRPMRDNSGVIGNLSPLDRPLKATGFPNQQASTKQDIVHSLRSLEAIIKDKVSKSKDTAPWLKLARFGDIKTDRNCLRHDSNVISIDGVETDYDAGEMPMSVAAQKCKDANIAALFYESPSNTPLSPRYRGLFPCSATLPPEQREGFVARVNGVLDGGIDNVSFNLSQSYYFGNIEGKRPINTILVEGRYLDLAHDLDFEGKGRRGPIGRRGGGAYGADETVKAELKLVTAKADETIKVDGSDELWKFAADSKMAGMSYGEFVEALPEQCPDGWRHVQKQDDKERAMHRVYDPAPSPVVAGDFDNVTNYVPEPVVPYTVTATPFTIKGLAAIPQREWIYSRCYARRLLSAVAATGGVGKSVLIIGEALAIATGKPLLGESLPMGARRVWHINSEDDKEELDRRFEAAIQLHEITQADLQNRLFYTGNETRFVIAKEDKGGLKIARPIVAAIKAEIRRLGIDVLTVDPFVSTHTVSENSNDKINAVAGLWRDIAQECNCSVVLVHHMRKPASSKPGQDATSYTVDDARGAGAFKDATRSFRIVNKMTEATATKIGLDDHWRYLHVTDGKANYSPPASAGKWFKLVSVGATAHDAGIGAVEPWEYPAVADGVSAPNLRRALEALRDGTGRHDPRSPQWAGKRVLATLGLDAAEKAKGKALLSAWVKEGYLTIESRQDEHRKSRDFYVVKSVPESGFQDESETDSDDVERGAE